jgi:hypothetical protein
MKTPRTSSRSVSAARFALFVNLFVRGEGHAPRRNAKRR